jgi:hypothetical protein
MNTGNGRVTCEKIKRACFMPQHRPFDLLRDTRFLEGHRLSLRILSFVDSACGNNENTYSGKQSDNLLKPPLPINFTVRYGLSTTLSLVEPSPVGEGESLLLAAIESVSEIHKLSNKVHG